MIRASFSASIFCAALLIGGCQPQGKHTESMTDKNLPDTGLPDGAIKASDTLYMIPVSQDESGCQQYSAHSTEGMTPAVIYYRRADGTFTMDRTEADCG